MPPDHSLDLPCLTSGASSGVLSATVTANATAVSGTAFDGEMLIGRTSSKVTREGAPIASLTTTVHNVVKKSDADFRSGGVTTVVSTIL